MKDQIAVIGVFMVGASAGALLTYIHLFNRFRNTIISLTTNSDGLTYCNDLAGDRQPPKTLHHEQEATALRHHAI